MSVERTNGLSIPKGVALDEFIASLAHEDRHALARLMVERKRLSASWPEMLDRYQKAADTTQLFSLSGDVASDIYRIQMLAALENRYGNIHKYFSG